MAIVGARRATPYGENIAYNAAFELAKHGVIIVSGLAYGIDSCAHRGCLDAGGITIAVLGTSIDKIYPRSNLALSERILEKGAIVSEYPPGIETKAYNFQERNRIVSGLADALLVIEASDSSGTKGTYSSACKQGKDIFVVPGDLTRPMSRGTNLMLRDGAFVYIDTSDILIRLGLYKPGKDEGYKLSTLSDIERKIYLEIKRGISRPDEIIKNLDLNITDYSCAVMRLEMDKYIYRDGIDWTIVA